MDLQYVFMVAAVVLVGLHSLEADNIYSQPPKVYCGRQLSDTLSAVCRGIYNTLNKKTDIYPSALNSPLRSKASASSMMSNFRRRRRRGVFNECCEKACSHEELLSYCGSN